MIQEKVEHLFKRFHLKYSIPLLMTVVSVYFWINFLDSDLLKIIGVAINITGLIVWWIAKITLAKNWGVGFGNPKIKQLVTHGIYSKIRHPMYWGINLTFVGLIFIYPKFWFLVLSALIILYFFYRMKIENSYLLKELGDEYRNYKRKTWI